MAYVGCLFIAGLRAAKTHVKGEGETPGKKEMERKNYPNNVAVVFGQIVSEPVESHELAYEKFYNMELALKRRSGEADILILQVSERLFEIEKLHKGMNVRVEGSFRSHRENTEERSYMEFYLFAEDIEPFDESNEEYTSQLGLNTVTLRGFIGKEPVVRTTPKGRLIAEVFLIVHRPINGTDVVHVILWGRDAKYMARFTKGTEIEVQGRIQSRRLRSGNTTYEVSERVLRVIDPKYNVPNLVTPKEPPVVGELAEPEDRPELDEISEDVAIEA